MKFTKIMMMASLTLVLFACEKEDNTLNNGLEKSAVTAKKANGSKSYMVLSKSETLSGDLEASVAKYGDVVNTIAEIGVIVVESSDPNFKKKYLE